MAIGSIAVNIVAKTDRFIAGLNSAQTRIGGFVKKIGALQTAVAGLAVAGFARFTMRVIESGDALFDTAQKIGIATDALGALRFAAEQVGTEASALDKSLLLMNRTIGEAQQGSGEAAAAVDRLGLSVEKLSAMSVNQRFLAIADAIRQLKTDTEQAAAAQDLFGRGGAELLPLIRTQREEILRLGDVAAETGGLIDDELGARMSDAADAIKEFKLAIGGLGVEFTSAFVPAITEIAGWLTTAVKLFQGLQLGIQMTTLSFQGLYQDTSVELAKLTEEYKALQADIQGRGTGGGGPLRQSAVVNTSQEEKAIEKAKKQAEMDAKKAAQQRERMTKALEKQTSSANNIELVQMGMR